MKKSNELTLDGWKPYVLIVTVLLIGFFIGYNIDRAQTKDIYDLCVSSINKLSLIAEKQQQNINQSLDIIKDLITINHVEFCLKKEVTND